MHEDDGRALRVAPGADHLGRVEPRVDQLAVARLVGDDLRLQPLERQPLGSRRRCDFLRRRSRRERLEMQLRWTVDRGVEIGQRLLVRRYGDLVASGGRRDARERAAINGHRVEVLFARMHLARGEEDLRAVLRQPGARDLPFPARERFRRRFRGGHVQRVEMHPALALGEHQDAFVVGQPGEAAAAEPPAAPAARAGIHRALPDPRVVVQGVDGGGLSRRRVELHQPAVVIVRRPDAGQAVRAILRAVREVPVDDARNGLVPWCDGLLVAGER